MKPEIIFVNEHDGLVTMTKEDVEKIVDAAYKSGQADFSRTFRPILSEPMPTKLTRITYGMKKVDVNEDD